MNKVVGASVGAKGQVVSVLELRPGNFFFLQLSGGEEGRAGALEVGVTCLAISLVELY